MARMYNAEHLAGKSRPLEEFRAVYRVEEIGPKPRQQS